MSLSFKRGGFDPRNLSHMKGTLPNKVPPGHWVVVVNQFQNVWTKDFTSFKLADEYYDEMSEDQYTNCWLLGPGARYNPNTGLVLSFESGGDSMKKDENFVFSSPFARMVNNMSDGLPPEATKPPTSCEFYDQNGFCRVTGAICPFYEITYKDCEVRKKALPYLTHAQR